MTVSLRAPPVAACAPPPPAPAQRQAAAMACAASLRRCARLSLAAAARLSCAAVPRASSRPPVQHLRPRVRALHTEPLGAVAAGPAWFQDTWARLWVAEHEQLPAEVRARARGSPARPPARPQRAATV